MMRRWLGCPGAALHRSPWSGAALELWGGLSDPEVSQRDSQGLPTRGGGVEREREGGREGGRERGRERVKAGKRERKRKSEREREGERGSECV
jgi:hypothetical protein